MLFLVLTVLFISVFSSTYIDDTPNTGEESGIVVSSFRSPPGLLLQLQTIGVVAPTGGMTFHSNVSSKFLPFLTMQENN